ncbi:adhesion G-protein coupled receptor G2-like [Chaetodon trifascialis]|uniref:adhesion G-protein coupled receptor G2-like n=1 Tax=Chaetodon trifascialis TaxID=109706 RepID=UPI003991706E
MSPCVSRRMCGLFFEGQWRWTHRFPLIIWLLLLAAAPPNAFGFFMGDTKAVLNGCEDHWTLQDGAAVPLLFQMTVCVNVRVVVPGAWVAFSYSSVHAPGPELGLEGDDEALYGWLLRVRHRFPLRLSPTDWHRVCLRRDVQRNTFSLEVDGEMVAERTVIAQAIPPSGSLWLGCRPRDRPLGAELGQVELYLFRMWEDLSDHGLCEDGTVIGWKTQYWGLTSSNARQRDASLLCASKTGVGRFFTTPPVPSATSSPVIVTPVTHVSNQTTQVTGSSLVNCDISQLCSNENAYFWMSISVEAEGGSKTEQDVHNLVSTAFGCHDEAARGVTGFIDFCQDDRQLQVVQVSCKAKRNIRKTTCDVLLQLSHAVSPCELQRAGVSALQQAGGQQIQARITGEVERVGRDLCEDVEPSSGGFVRCTSTSSLEDICQANKQSKLTCSLIEPHSNPAPQPMAESCSREVRRFCDCTAFCNSTSQFFATRINISSASVSVDLLKGLGAHLECHGTQQRLYSCMVILEMSGPVDSCSLNKLLHRLMDSSPGITSERPLTRMAVCGPPGLPVRTLLTSNLTWVASDLLTSDLCQADPSLLKCEANEMLAVLLTDSCPPTTQPSTVASSSVTTAPGASMSSVTNTAAQTPTTAETTAAHKHLNASQGTAQPNATTPLTATSSAQSSTAPPVLHTSSQHVTPSGSTTAQSTALSNNTTSLMPTESTKLPNASTAQQNTTGFPTSSASSTLQISTTLTPNHTTRYNVTTADTFTPSPNDTTLYSVTTADDRNLHNSTMTTTNTTVSTFTPTPTNRTAVIDTTTDYTTEYNVTTADSRSLHNGTTMTSNATMSTFTPSSNYTTMYNLTTVSNSSTTAESMITTTVSPTTAADNVTASPIRETQQSTTAPSQSTTKSARQTLNAMTSTTDSAVTTNSTTSTAGVSPIIDLNQTAGINLSSTASSSTAAADPTTEGPGVSLTAAATSPTLGPLPVQISTTTAEVSPTSPTTPTFTSTTTTKPGNGTTPTTTAETTKSQEAQEELANELLDQIQDASQLNSSQVEQVAQQLEKLLDGPTVSQAVGQKAVSIISNLMEGDSQALSASANRLIRVVDDLGLKLVVAGDREVISSNSLVLAVRTVDGTNFPATSVDIFNTDNVQLRALSGSRFKRSGSALGSVFLPSSLTTGLSPEQQQQASRVQFTFYTKSALFQDATLDNQTLVSPVLASSVANLSISNLSENIQFTIRNINRMNASNASCAFWDFTLNGGGGGWSSAGCFLVNATPEETSCSCNHLTSFAILLDLSREGLADRQQAQILTFITYIGCGISAIFLAVTLLTYLSFEKLLRDIPAKILVQLCMSLLLLNLVFLLDGWLALYPAIGLCISTAFFLHYFLLTSFTWAGLEALHMYLSVIQVFTPYLSRYMLKFSLMGWGIPLIVVIVVISVDKDNYGLVTYGKYTDGSSDDFCWLRNDIAFYVGVVAYFLLIFALCLLVFIMVMVQLARIKKQNPQNQSPNRGVLTDLRSIAGLIILLGLTWGFALFAWGPLYLPFVYLFSIFNTLQGFLVFVFHCAVKENVRRQWRTYLCCGRLRLAENSEWSRTATHNNRNTSVATATTSARHFTSRSSSVISDGTNSSGSVFADSGISDASSSDVVLNEIHRRNLML